jgi:hypothetical protein
LLQTEAKYSFFDNNLPVESILCKDIIKLNEGGYLMTYFQGDILDKEGRFVICEEQHSGCKWWPFVEYPLSTPKRHIVRYNTSSAAYDYSNNLIAVSFKHLPRIDLISEKKLRSSIHLGFAKKQSDIIFSKSEDRIYEEDRNHRFYYLDIFAGSSHILSLYDGNGKSKDFNKGKYNSEIHVFSISGKPVKRITLEGLPNPVKLSFHEESGKIVLKFFEDGEVKLGYFTIDL